MQKLNEDWVAIAIAVLVIALALLGALPQLPWPLLGLFK